MDLLLIVVDGVSYLVSVVFTKEWSGEDENVEDDAETVEGAERGNEAGEGGLQVKICFGDHQQRHSVACSISETVISVFLWGNKNKTGQTFPWEDL